MSAAGQQLPFAENWPEALRLSPLPLLLFVTHRIGGGVERHVCDLVKVLHGRANVLVLRPAEKRGRVCLSWLAGKGGALGFDDLSILKAGLLWMGVARIHVHHLVGFSPGFESWLTSLGLPVDLTLHDHAIINGNPTLSDISGVFDPRCLAIGGRLPEGDAALCGALRAVASQARRIFVPSRYLAGVVGRFLPETPLQVRVPPDAEGGYESEVSISDLATDESMRVLCLGTFTPEKGLHVLRRVASLARKRKAPLEFILLGESFCSLPGNVRVLGRYDDASLGRAVRELDPHLIWLPMQCPETWSYTLSAALEAGLPVLASRVGALVERTEGRPGSWLLNHRAGVETWLGELLRIRLVFQSNPVGGGWGKASIPSFYKEEGSYLMVSEAPVAPALLISDCPFSLGQALRLGRHSLPSWRQRCLGVLRKWRARPYVGMLFRCVPRGWMRRARRLLLV